MRELLQAIIGAARENLAAVREAKHGLDLAADRKIAEIRYYNAGACRAPAPTDDFSNMKD